MKQTICATLTFEGVEARRIINKMEDIFGGDVSRHELRVTKHKIELFGLNLERTEDEILSTYSSVCEALHIRDARSITMFTTPNTCTFLIIFEE